MNESREVLIRETVEHIIRAVRCHHATCDRETGESGVHRSQHKMLMYIHRNGGAAMQGEIAREMHITPAVVTVTLNKLEEERLIVRRPSPNDKRSRGIELTDSGIELVKQTRGILDRVDGWMFRGFQDSELLRLQEYFSRILLNLTQKEEADNL